MSLWKFTDNDTIFSPSGANTKAGLIVAGQLIEQSFLKGKRNVIITSAGWVRRTNKTDTHGNVRQHDEILVAARPAAGLSYVSNTYMRYPKISQVYFSSNSTGGSALQRTKLANCYIVFNHPVVFGPDASLGIATVTANSAGVGAAPASVLRLVGTGAQGGRVTVDTVGVANAVATFHVSNSGSGFVVGRNYTTVKVSGGGWANNVSFIGATLVPSGTIKLLLSNTAGGNSMRMVSNNVSGTGLINANNTVVFKFVPAVAGTYKIAAQTMANSSATALVFKSRNTGAASANLVLTGAVSNVAGTFTVRSATTGG
jgi:hypothetical protein